MKFEQTSQTVTQREIPAVTCFDVLIELQIGGELLHMVEQNVGGSASGSSVCVIPTIDARSLTFSS